LHALFLFNLLIKKSPPARELHLHTPGSKPLEAFSQSKTKRLPPPTSPYRLVFISQIMCFIRVIHPVEALVIANPIFLLLLEVFVMAQIIVKSKHGDVAIIVDDGMVEFLKDYYKVFNVKTGYVQCRLKSSKNKSTIPLQRLVANTPKGYFTHHINHNKNDYRLENLEIIKDIISSQSTL
jgi:hypothetical protein